MKHKSDDFPIAHWISEGQQQKAIHLIVAYDAQDGNYKPVFVKAGENIEQKRREYSTGYYSVLTDLPC